MKNQFKIVLTRDPNGIALTAISKNLPQAGKRLTVRGVPSFNAFLIDELRQGTPKLASVVDASNKLSDWLLGPDLQAYLDAAILGLQNNEQLHLIFDVDRQLREDANVREALADLPLELLQLQGDNVPLVLNSKSAAFVHLLDKVPYAPTSTTQRYPPLRVLIVQSNPVDLGGAVPDPGPIRQQIVNLGSGLGPKLVEVDMLSRQPGEGVIGLPTPEGLWNLLASAPLPYDILIYLGHGDRAQNRDDLLPLGLVYLEVPDGTKSEPVTADRLAQELQNHPVPVVLLMGCLTAADLPANQKDGILAAMPRAMRGNQGVAQALVNSSSGVQIAVGMRYKLESDDAKHFLSAFFKSLLKDHPGNVEAGVHAGRQKLHAISTNHGSFSAPMIFGTLRDEPIFDFLASPPALTLDERDQAFRAVLWDSLKRKSMSKITPEDIKSLTDALEDMEKFIVNNMVPKAPLLMPEWRLVQEDQKITIPINLHGPGPLNLEELEGKLIVDGEGVNIEKVKGTPNLAGNYQVLTDENGNQASFQIKRCHSATGPLPPGPLMDASITLGPARGVTYPVTLSWLKPKPKLMICAGNNVIIVPTP
jgi:hypothetical protein